MTLHILLGTYGAGKTATAKYLVKGTGGAYIDVEYVGKDGGILLDKLKQIVLPGNDYYIDGWVGAYLPALGAELGMPAKYIVCMAPVNLIIERQKTKRGRVHDKLPLSIPDIEKHLFYSASVALTFDKEPLFADTTVYPPVFWSKREWLNKWLELSIYSRFAGAGEYQDVEFDSHVVRGLSQSYKTWERLKDLIQFEGKIVCEYGCNYGYYCFKAEEAGASQVIGVDIAPSILNMARIIAMTKSSSVVFIEAELKTYEPVDTEIIMALNIMHHLGYEQAALRAIFGHAQQAVFELPADDVRVVNEVAKSFSFNEPVIASSHRDGRCIAVYDNSRRCVVVPNRWVYRPRRAAFIKLMKRTAYKLAPPFARGKLRRVARYLRRRRGR